MPSVTRKLRLCLKRSADILSPTNSPNRRVAPPILPQPLSNSQRQLRRIVGVADQQEDQVDLPTKENRRPGTTSVTLPRRGHNISSQGKGNASFASLAVALGKENPNACSPVRA